jgi:hypothetical protein
MRRLPYRPPVGAIEKAYPAGQVDLGSLIEAGRGVPAELAAAIWTGEAGSAKIFSEGFIIPLADAL